MFPGTSAFRGGVVGIYYLADLWVLSLLLRGLLILFVCGVGPLVWVFRWFESVWSLAVMVLLGWFVLGVVDYFKIGYTLGFRCGWFLRVVGSSAADVCWILWFTGSRFGWLEC